MSDFDNNSNKYNDLGREVKDSIFEAINTGNLSGLSGSISKTIATAFDDMGDALNMAASGGLSDAQRHYREQMSRAQEIARRYHEEQEEQLRRNKEMRAANIRKPNQTTSSRAGSTGSASVSRQAAATATAATMYNKFKAVGMVKGPVKIIAGGWGLLISLFLLFGAMLASEFIFGIIFFLLFGGVAGLVFGSGLRDLILLRKARNFNRILGSRDYCTLDELAMGSGMDRGKTLKTLKKILSRGNFPQGYVDKEGTTFMNSRQVYEEYLKTSRYRAEHPEEFAAKQAQETITRGNTPVAETINNPSGVKLSPEQLAELQVMMNDGQNAIKRLHELNDDIPGEAITAKLYTTEGLLNDIFNRVKEHPEQMKKCHKLMNYHLPTMLKLVEAYAEYDKVTVPGPEILKAKEEIEKTMDVINEAFVELLNRMFQDSVWDVTADAQVLKSMLTQEGLAKDIVVEQAE